MDMSNKENRDAMRRLKQVKHDNALYMRTNDFVAAAKRIVNVFDRNRAITHLREGILTKDEFNNGAIY